MAVRDWALAIDFGTSNTAAAHTSPISGAVEALTLSHNRTTMSSSVFVESPDRIAVGEEATDRAESNPAAFIPAPKRAIGQGVNLTLSRKTLIGYFNCLPLGRHMRRNGEIECG